MASLALFCDQSTGISQATNKSFGIDTADTNKFRVNSTFNVTGTANAYAMVSGTVLLQQQTGVPAKVNLILRPHNQSDLKLPIKYIIYRGLETTAFIDSNNLTDPSNKVKTAGSEFLAAMQVIQQQRAPGDDIPIQALFGNELAPVGTKNIDEFFFKNLAAASQLFTIDCGIELGKFATGEVSIEIILENPEYFLTVEDAKNRLHEINVTGLANAEKKWKQDLVRHFVDPAAYYGLHYDIAGGIEYRTGSGKQYANTPALVYNQIVDKFLTKNKVYLDVRNENGYSYNYYGSYVGTGVDANKNIKIGQTAATLVAKEYYTNGWAIHTIDVTAGSGAENEIFVALRINDNERPLIAGWNYALLNTSGTGTIVPDKNVYFADEIVLLPNPVSDFTNAVSFKIPNVSGSTPAQLATIAKLDYIKQLIPLTNTNIFPKQNFLDYIFGPLDVTIPWDSADAVQWFTNNNRPYVDALHNGFVLGKYKTTILSINTTEKEIEIYDEVPVDLSHPVLIENSTPNNGNAGPYTPTGIRFSANKTFIKVKEDIPLPLQTGDQLTLVVKLDGKLDPSSNKFIFENKNITNLEVLSANNQLDFYNVFNFSNSFTIASAVFVSPNTEINFTDSKFQSGFSGFVETGAIVETDQSVTPPLDNDRLMFYAAPSNYFSSNGITKSSGFNSSGGVLKYDSILKGLEAMMPDVQIKKDNLMIGTENILTFSYSSQSKAKQALFLLGLTKPEWEAAKTASASLIGIHNRLFKLNGEGKTKTDKNGTSYYEYQLMVAGLDNTGAFQEINTAISIYTTDHIIFGSKNFAAKYGIDVTQAEIALNNFIHNTLNGNGSDFSNLNNFSNEESIQIRKNNLWTQKSVGDFSIKIPNKSLFELDPTMKDKIIQFKNDLDIIQNEFSLIETLVKSKGSDILNYAKQRIKMPNEDYTNKDGILYLTRLIMQIVLKNHPKLLSNYPNKINELSSGFEMFSRGLAGSEQPNFKSYPTAKKRVLIAGYDPFGAGSDWGGHNSNPSGNIALALDGFSIEDENENEIGIIHSVIFPVRYKEFNEKWVEDFFLQYINDEDSNYQKVDMIITFSYGGAKYFNMDRFAARYRNPNHTDNEEKPGGFSSYLNEPDKNELEFIATSLPVNDLYIAEKVVLHQRAFFYYSNGNQITGNNNTSVKNFNLTPLLPIPSIDNYPPPSGVIADGIKSYYGSGGDYLSNEIFYRVAFLRNQHNEDLMTGHIHVGYLDQQPSASQDRVSMLNIIKSSIKAAVINL